MIFLEIICFEFPFVAGARITDPKHEELVLNAIASNPQARFDFFSDFHVKYLGVRSQNSGYSMFPILICVEISFQDSPSFFSIRRFGSLCPSVPSFRCCEGVASLSSSAGMNYL